MKKIAIGLLTYMLLMSSAYACQTQIITVNGKTIVCTYCPNYVVCS